MLILCLCKYLVIVIKHHCYLIITITKYCNNMLQNTFGISYYQTFISMYPLYIYMYAREISYAPAIR